MQQRSYERTMPGTPHAEQPLSVTHARALYQPVPPVEYDEDGYPFSDGHFEMEGDFHSSPLRALQDALRVLFEDRDDVYYAFDMGFFFEQGNRRAVVVPDAFVVFGTSTHSRNSFKLWEGGKVPDFVMEVISADSIKKDVEYKPPLYAALGVTEYWTFDSLGRLPTPIVALRLTNAGVYGPIPRRPDGSYRSEVLGLDLRVEKTELKVRDASSGQDYLGPGALARKTRIAEARAETAEARVAELEELLRKSTDR